MLNRIGPGLKAWHTPLVIGLQLEWMRLMTTLWSWKLSYFWICLTNHLSRLDFISLLMRIWWETVSKSEENMNKGNLLSQWFLCKKLSGYSGIWHDIHDLFDMIYMIYIRWKPNTCSWFSFCKFMLTSLKSLIFLNVTGKVFWDYMLSHLPSISGVPNGPVVSLILILVCLQQFAFFHCARISCITACYHDLSKVVEFGNKIFQFHQHLWEPGPIDLWIFSFFKYSQIWSFY